RRAERRFELVEVGDGAHQAELVPGVEGAGGLAGIGDAHGPRLYFGVAVQGRGEATRARDELRLALTREGGGLGPNGEPYGEAVPAARCDAAIHQEVLSNSIRQNDFVGGGPKDFEAALRQDTLEFPGRRVGHAGGRTGRSEAG